MKKSYKKEEILTMYGMSDSTWYRNHHKLKQLTPTEPYLIACKWDRVQPDVRYYSRSIQEVFGARKDQHKLDENSNPLHPLRKWFTREDCLKLVSKTQFQRKKHLIEEYCGLYNPRDFKKVFITVLRKRGFNV